MGNVIEFKAKEENREKTYSKPAKVIGFPNMREYIEFYEKFLNGRKDKKSIANAFYRINKIVKNLDDPYEKALQIVHFVNYFTDSIGEELFSQIMFSYEEEPATIKMYKIFQEDKIIDESFDLLDEIDDDYRNTLEEMATYMCFKMRGDVVIAFVPEDFQTQIFISKDDEDVNRKAQLLLSLFARSNFSHGVFIIHNMIGRKHTVCAIVVDTEGIYGIDPKELRKEINDKNVICYDLDLNKILE